MQELQHSLLEPLPAIGIAPLLMLSVVPWLPRALTHELLVKMSPDDFILLSLVMRLFLSQMMLPVIPLQLLVPGSWECWRLMG